MLCPTRVDGLSTTSEYTSAPQYIMNMFSQVLSRTTTPHFNVSVAASKPLSYNTGEWYGNLSLADNGSETISVKTTKHYDEYMPFTVQILKAAKGSEVHLRTENQSLTTHQSNMLGAFAISPDWRSWSQWVNDTQSHLNTTSEDLQMRYDTHLQQYIFTWLWNSTHVIGFDYIITEVSYDTHGILRYFGLVESIMDQYRKCNFFGGKEMSSSSSSAPFVRIDIATLVLFAYRRKKKN